MPKRHLLSLLMRWFALTTLGALALATALTWQTAQLRHIARVSATLKALGAGLAPRLAPLVTDGDLDGVARWLAPLAEATGTRVTLIDNIGLSLYDSRSLPLALRAEALPEFRQALAGRIGVDRRMDPHSRRRLVFVALPIGDADQPLGALRLIESEAMARAGADDAWQIALWSGAVALVVALAAAVIVYRRLNCSLKDLRRLAEHFGEGTLDARPPMPAIAELRDLAGAMRAMADRLDQRIRHETMRRMEEEAILSAMVEGVLAVDNRERVLRMNPTAGRLLAATPDHARGRAVQEVAPHADLLRFIYTALARREVCAADVTLKTIGPDVRLDVHGVPLFNDQGGFLGVALTLHDVTRLQRLENIRRDFVANVSHELRTPITSIQGYLETLMDAPLEDQDQTRRFLTIIRKHVDRLNAIIEDLLRLSRLEQEDLRDDDARLTTQDLGDIVQTALQVCETRIREKDIQIRMNAAEDIAAPADAPLLEQALVNLIDNAVNYSDPGGDIAISLARSGDEVAITVRDRGCGIPHEDQGRLFERFYRVDKARSRKLGGTGLGLAIVKHIVQLHRGRVTVESQVGVGSAFTLYLPVA